MASLSSVWREEFVLHVTQAPRSLRMQANWTSMGPTSGIFFMAISPPENGQRVFYHANPEICLRFPDAALVTGDWRVMLHAAQTVDLTDTIIVTMNGGSATIEQPDGTADAGSRQLLQTPC